MAAQVNVSVVKFNRIPAMARALSTDSNRIVQKVATDVQADVIDSFSGAKSGRYYAIPGVNSSRKGGGGRRHRASGPGQPPARMFGLLAGSITVKRSSNRAIVGAGAEYAPHLEYGTVNMAPRPFLRPVAKKYRAIFEMAVKVMVERAMSGR